MKMKKHTILGTALLAGALAVTTGMAVAEQTYVMTCRGGGDMVAVIGQRVSDPRVFVEITYHKGNAGAGVKAPALGECTWIDRGMVGDEPNKMLFDDHAVSWTQTVCRAGECHLNTPSHGATQLMKYVRRAEPFQVHVFNNRQGHMVVTKIGP
ncbi:hypothetical protein [Aliiroseovarius subalbicans]|uniref:hypothetical protein n=1 Tax=Aliiroseovarius subalbicans TaxID=2925840 RepID=UPI001F5ABAB9|nr:hypothetical protein [Aliiroseovarius subalbicans]MCI2400720.1 hypothetical protein [Aliiroseovarius subalbicans]